MEGDLLRGEEESLGAASGTAEHVATVRIKETAL